MTYENADDPPEETGPPHGGRYPKGTSGNPRGRPKGARNLPNKLLKELNKTVTVNEDGKRRRMTKGDLTVRSLANKAAKGDLNAAKLIRIITKDVDDDTLAVRLAAISGPEDDLVIHEVIKRIRQANDDGNENNNSDGVA